MDQNKFEARKNLAQTMIKNLEKRNMEGFFVGTKEEAVTMIMDKFLTAGKSVCFGGSMSLTESGLMEKVRTSDCILYDRMTAKTPEEVKKMKANMINSDYFLMSTNAITTDGELINIDGTGNRVSYLCYGPEHVIILAGMNKVVSSVEDGVRRVRDFASPPNTVRLNRNTPCAKTGRCGDCYSEECICSQIVITRRSGTKGRIKVVLVAEELGY
ncbi:MAG: lactate utilization protein [Roseburia sp.]|nr:lactate utilization protein [Roseburia sp.]